MNIGPKKNSDVKEAIIIVKINCNSPFDKFVPQLQRNKDILTKIHNRETHV